MNLYLTTMKLHSDRNRQAARQAPGKRILTLVAGATGGGTTGFAALEPLLRQGYRLIVVASAAALGIYGRENLASLTGQPEILDGSEGCPPELVQTVEFVYLPVVSANLIGKLAGGIYDEPLATLIFHALMAGKEVIGVADGAQPDGSEFRRRGFANPPAGLAELLNVNLAKVAAQNIRLYPAAAIAGVLAERAGTAADSMDRATICWNQRKKIITQADLKGLAHVVLSAPPVPRSLTPPGNTPSCRISTFR